MDEVFTDVRLLFGALPAKDPQKIKRKKKRVAASNEVQEEESLKFSGQRIVFVLGKIESCLASFVVKLSVEYLATPKNFKTLWLRGDSVTQKQWLRGQAASALRSGYMAKFKNGKKGLKASKRVRHAIATIVTDPCKR